MDNQEKYSVPSRAEVIKIARDSCTRNLSSVNKNNKNQNMFKNKDQSIMDKYELENQTGVKAHFTLPGNGLAMNSMTVKFFLIRLICAFMLFLTVLLIDKFDVKLKAINSEYVQELVSTNQGIEAAQDYVVSFFEQFAKEEE